MNLDQIHEYKDIIRKLGDYAKEYQQENILHACIKKWQELDTIEKSLVVPW